MDAYATAGICRQAPYAGSTGTYLESSRRPKIPSSVRCNAIVSRFADEGHLGFYSAGGRRRIRCGVKSETRRSDVKVKDKETSKLMKKKAKLLKNLSRDLFTMTQIGFGFDCADGYDLLDRDREQEKGAAEALLTQLQELKKKKVYDEKCEDSSSSSSSSESSDSDCQGSINMNRTKHKPVLLLDSQPLFNQESLYSVSKPMIDESTSSIKNPDSQPLFYQESLYSVSKPMIDESTSSIKNPDLQPLFNQESLYSVSKPRIVESASSIKNPDSQPLFNQESLYSLSKPMIDEHASSESGIQAQKIEVCMGGKCKKSGAQAILEELQNAVGVEGAVCGSKCMGKCKLGPNVRLSGARDDLCLGVGIQDVSLIASGFLRVKGKELVAS